MEKGLRYTEALGSTLKGATVGRLDSALSSLSLLERSRKVRRLTELSIRGIEVEPIPASLESSQGAIVVSNYPSVSQSLRAVIKVGCRISTERVRIRAIARPEIITEANLMSRTLGVGQFVFPVYKDQAGAYRLEGRQVKDILRWLDGPGNVLWLSITGRARGNGLLEGDLRTGAALFSFKKGIPLVPMGLVTKEQKGRLKVIGVKFGEPICPVPAGDVDDFERTDYLIDLTTLAMCEIARLLPRGQRGDFEEAEQKLEETRRRLGIE
jgi:hypothetical protein